MLFARMRMAMVRQLLFPKSEQWVIAQYLKRELVQLINSRRAERTLATMCACTSDTLRV
jgi:hypothetical protein